MSIYKIAEQFVLNKLKKLENGRLRLSNHDGEVFNFGKNSSPLNADITIANKRFYLDIILGGSSALGEAYVNKEFETSDLTKLIEITARNIQLIYTFSGSAKLQTIKNLLKKIFMSNTRSKSLKYISKHYDLGNEFFAKWLDKTLTYSSAIYENKNDDLETAQKNKYRKLIDLLNLKSGDKVLEIGCGWGGFSEFVAKKYEVSVDCITISKKQFEYAKERIQKCGLNEKVKIQIKDYRDLQGKYNSIASIEMIEAVGQNYLDGYFKTIKDNLSGGGKAAIQAITIDDSLFDRYKNKQDFIQKYIFPGGFLPNKNSINRYVSDNGLTINSYISYADHYADTLEIWRNEFLKKWELIKNQGFDLKFKRMWEFYLSYCEAGFKSKNIDLIQFSLQNK